jgi:translation initiation factor 2B subunit (eIF-2B alpha/beta/delta family)
MITDAMAGIFVPKADAVIVGADAVLKNENVINKTGSLSLAILCKHFNKPFYVVTTKSKYLNKKYYRINEDSSGKVWKYSHPNLTTKNIQFEEIDKKLIKEIISEV